MELIAKHFSYVSFPRRLWEILSKVLGIYVFAFVVASILTGHIYLSMGVASLFIVISVLAWFKDTRYFITELVIKNNGFFIKAYEYDRLIINDFINVSDIMISKGVARSSNRGTSYKLKLIYKNLKLEQYEICGWTSSDFDKILDVITLISLEEKLGKSSMLNNQ